MGFESTSVRDWRDFFLSRWAGLLIHAEGAGREGWRRPLVPQSEWRLTMRQMYKRAIRAGSVASVVAAGVIVAPAYATPAPQSVTITAKSATCSVTGTFQWNRVSGLTYAFVEVYDYDSGAPLGSATPRAFTSSGRVSVTASGMSGHRYYAHGGFAAGSTGGSLSSEPVTLSCR